MRLAEATWHEIDALDRDTVVVIPTGSLEQHGPHLPLLTDTILVESVCQAAASQVGEGAILTPTIWLGESGHHLPYAGSLSASHATYSGAIRDCVHSLSRHGFRVFALINGHGGNISANDLILRELKEEDPSRVLAATDYFRFLSPEIEEILEGPQKSMGHACEAETSLMLHLRPELVRMNLAVSDGFIAKPPIDGLVLLFDERSEHGPVGHPTYANAEKGRRLFELAVSRTADWIKALRVGYHLERPSVDPHS